MTCPSTCESRSRQAGRPADFPGRLKGLAPPRGPLGMNFRSFMGLLVSWVPEYGNLGAQGGDFSCSPWLTLPHRFPHKRARPPPLPTSGLSRFSRLHGRLRSAGKVRPDCAAVERGSVPSGKGSWLEISRLMASQVRLPP